MTAAKATQTMEALGRELRLSTSAPEALAALRQYQRGGDRHDLLYSLREKNIPMEILNEFFRARDGRETGKIEARGKGAIRARSGRAAPLTRARRP